MRKFFFLMIIITVGFSACNDGKVEYQKIIVDKNIEPVLKEIKGWYPTQLLLGLATPYICTILTIGFPLINQFSV